MWEGKPLKGKIPRTLLAWNKARRFQEEQHVKRLRKSVDVAQLGGRKSQCWSLPDTSNVEGAKNLKRGRYLMASVTCNNRAWVTLYNGTQVYERMTYCFRAICQRTSREHLEDQFARPRSRRAVLTHMGPTTCLRYSVKQCNHIRGLLACSDAP
jgi:hypothetical protein